MLDAHEEELRLAVAEGILRREDAAALAQEARQKNLSPLALLLERGRLSEDTLASLRAKVPGGVAWTASGTGPTPVERRTDGMDTLPLVAETDDAPAFPIPGWDRYLSIRFLGQGGMGKVFLAVDPRLRREVAIKFVRGDNPEHVRRLIGEARSQARVSHDRVCKVHEVGEVDGKVYIAMQYIDGASLGSLAGELTIEQKVLLVRGAVDGIQEAHRAGIIHRDIKPSNIMVERSPDGALKPYVMDFGLARAVADDGETLSGAVVGTPRYMAPEQANGSPGELDRRADIYSLGATLYHLLAGRPPIPGNNFLEVMHNLSTMEPRPLRAVAPAIPADLEAIVMKCLEKDRASRYDSARALGHDLDSFLAGEPVAARAAGPWYRLRKRLAKHRRLVAAASVALLATVIAIGWGIQTRRDSNERERLARRFTESVERIEAMARYSALSPIHDIRGDQAAIRARMAQLQDEIQRAGDVAAGPGHYALGRGYLALDDDARARLELEAAWHAGFREPRVAYALALAMGHLYQQQLLAAERIEQKPVREAKRREIEQQYRDPALHYLAASKGAEVPSPEYVAALVAFYEGHFDDALHHVDAIGSGLAWFYEAPQLRGNILLARSLQHRNQGERDQARADVQAGRAAYESASAAGQSVIASYESLGELEYVGLVLELYGAGNVVPSFERTIAAMNHALAVIPDYYDALVFQARAYRGLAEHKTAQGSDTDDLLAKATAAAQRAITASPDRPQARRELAAIYRQAAEERQKHNEDPTEQLRSGATILDSIAATDRDATYYMDLALVFSIWADYQDRGSVSSTANRTQAIAASLRALQINDQLIDNWLSLGISYFKRAEALHADTADNDIEQAIAALDKARSIDSKNIVSYFYGGEVYELAARRKQSHGLDPRPDLAKALATYQAGVGINAKIPHLHNGIGIALLMQARDDWDRGANPDLALDRAGAAFAQAIAVAPTQAFGYTNAGDAAMLRASFRALRDDDPSEDVRTAAATFQRALERLPEHPAILADLGAVHAIQAKFLLEHGKDPQPSVSVASSALRRALRANPKDARAHMYLGQVHDVVARFHARTDHPRAQDFEEARAAFRRALELDPDDQECQVTAGQFYRTWALIQHATGADASATLEHGQELARRLLAVRPSWPDALVLRAGLLLVQAQSSPDPGIRRATAVKAGNDFSRALAANPNLTALWRTQNTTAQQVAAPAK